MYHTYILQSQKNKEKFYVGYTTDLSRRVKEHNTQPTSSYVKSYAPWKLAASVSVQKRTTAEKLEKYFKNGTGYAFFKKRLL